MKRDRRWDPVEFDPRKWYGDGQIFERVQVSMRARPLGLGAAVQVKDWSQNNC